MYDVKNRLTETTYRKPPAPGGAEGTGALWERVLRTYDPMGNLLAVEGELSGIRVEYQYRPDAPAADPHTHELYKATWMLAGVPWHTVTHGYDAEGRRVTTTVDAGLPGSHAQAFAYDDANRLLSIANDGTTQASFAYASGFLVTTTLGNGNRISRTYDAKGRLESLEHATTAGKTLAKIVYGYDKRDRRTSVQYPHLGITSTFTYTDNSWLASESHAFSTAAPVFGNPEVATYGGNASAPTAGATVTPAPPSGSGIALSISYTYDERGNRTAKDVAGTTTGDATYLYDLEDRLLSESRDGGATTVAYAWANRGDMVGRTKTTGAVVESESFVTDYLARITAYLPPTGPTSTYIHAPTGDRIAKHVGGAAPVEWSLPDGGDVLADFTKLGTDPEEFTGIYVSPGTDGRLARINASSIPTYYFGDSLNSVHQMTDVGGFVTGTNFTDTWGNGLAIGLTPTSGPGSRYGFTGRENDTESGLMHFRARSYDVVSGRFTSRDPVIGSNLYVYASNSPTNKVDPSGRFDYDIHPEITSDAINKLSNPDAIKIFGSKYNRTLVGEANSDVDPSNVKGFKHPYKAEEHFDNEMIKAGVDHIRELISELKQPSKTPTLYQALITLGQVLHALQDFYAHSNYVELYFESKNGRAPVPEGGIEVDRVELWNMEATENVARELQAERRLAFDLGGGLNLSPPKQYGELKMGHKWVQTAGPAAFGEYLTTGWNVGSWFFRGSPKPAGVPFTHDELNKDNAKSPEGKKLSKFGLSYYSYARSAAMRHSVEVIQKDFLEAIKANKDVWEEAQRGRDAPLPGQQPR